jgi:hypothetical protein
MHPALAWAVLLGGWGAPLLHILLSPRGGPFRPPPGARCPLGPRVGWLVLALLLGPVGWALYLKGRRRLTA